MEGPTSFAEGEWVGVQCKRPIGKNAAAPDASHSPLRCKYDVIQVEFVGVPFQDTMLLP